MTARGTSRSFRVAAAALAAAPVGFAAGALLAARQLATPAAVDGLTILAHGLTGAIVAALLLTMAALTLPPKPVRIVTLVFAGASFAILVYMVQDFIVERVERAQARDAAYQRHAALRADALGQEPATRGILSTSVQLRDPPLRGQSPRRLALRGHWHHQPSGRRLRGHADRGTRGGPVLRLAGVLAHHRRGNRNG